MSDTEKIQAVARAVVAFCRGCRRSDSGMYVPVSDHGAVRRVLQGEGLEIKVAIVLWAETRRPCGVERTKR